MTTSIYRARNHSEGGPRRSGDSTNLEIKAYRGYLEPSYLEYVAVHIRRHVPRFRILFRAPFCSLFSFYLCPFGLFHRACLFLGAGLIFHSRKIEEGGIMYCLKKKKSNAYLFFCTMRYSRFAKCQGHSAKP